MINVNHLLNHYLVSPGYISYDFKKTSLIINFGDDFLGHTSASISTIADYTKNQKILKMISFSQ